MAHDHFTSDSRGNWAAVWFVLDQSLGKRPEPWAAPHRHCAHLVLGASSDLKSVPVHGTSNNLGGGLDDSDGSTDVIVALLCELFVDGGHGEEYVWILKAVVNGDLPTWDDGSVGGLKSCGQSSALGLSAHDCSLTFSEPGATPDGHSATFLHCATFNFNFISVHCSLNDLFGGRDESDGRADAVVAGLHEVGVDGGHGERDVGVTEAGGVGLDAPDKGGPGDDGQQGT